MSSMRGQSFLLQRESVAGVPENDAMFSFQSLKAKPGFGEDGGSSFTGSGWRGTSARVLGDEYGTVSIAGIQDFQAIVVALGSLLGEPVTTQPDVANAPAALQHVFSLAGRGARTPVTWTAQWGDTDLAMQLAYFVFNTLGFGVKRAEVTFETSGMGRTPDLTEDLATTGVTDVPAVPIPPNQYNVYADDTYGGIGVTQLLACYDAMVAMGEVWGRDTPINRSIVSFQGLQENEEIDYSGNMQIGFNPTAVALRTSFRAGATKFMRLEVLGPIIAATVRYSLMVDYAVKIIKTGEVTTAPNSGTVVLPFDYELTADGSNPLLKFTVVNTIDPFS